MKQKTSYVNEVNEQTVAQTGVYFGLYTAVRVVSFVWSGLQFSLMNVPAGDMAQLLFWKHVLEIYITIYLSMDTPYCLHIYRLQIIFYPIFLACPFWHICIVNYLRIRIDAAASIDELTFDIYYGLV